MTGEEAIAYIHDRSWLGSRLGLDRTRALLDALGNPQEQLRFVHVAGTNGKGSVAAMCAAMLRAAGYRTGLYTSPYLRCF
ncbi:MAG: bifunctional folylpolyglutamate synthase/dihydrofolate synthase, partial [Clostridiales bacterium]|nr:bifunctional folylpolyglutamate synthase/dihydrofolate synthase [Clostridiales bacterium]